MPSSTETVSLPGSGLVFINTYAENVSEAYRSAVLTAENFLQSHFANAVTVQVNFGLAPRSDNATSDVTFSAVTVSYATLVGALQSHATTSDDLLAVAGLPAADPSRGAGFAIPRSEAIVLGLAAQTNGGVVTFNLNSNLNWTYGQDVVAALESGLTEGVFGRIGTLGLLGSPWGPMDLFRFTAGGVRDYSGGVGGVTSYFGLDSAHVTSFAFHIDDSRGHSDGGDLADWIGTSGDAFGPGGPGLGGTISATDLRVLDVLGWTPASGPALTPADDFANNLSDATRPMGGISTSVAAPGASVTGSLEVAGDHDWFRVELDGGFTYTIDLQGGSTGHGTLADPYLRLRDANGAQVIGNDDIAAGSSPDSRLVFTPDASGTYYLDAGAFADGYAGTYRLNVSRAVSDDFANYFSDTSRPLGALTPGGATQGAIEVGGDRDWFRVELTAGTNYLVTVRGLGEGGGTLPQAQLSLLSESGFPVLITVPWMGVGGASGHVDTGAWVFHPDRTGVYYVGAAAGPSSQQDTGSYTVRVLAGAPAATGGDDVLIGGRAASTVAGGMGNDTLFGDDVSNRLRGDEGNDSIQGGGVFDDINGNMGDDTAAGGLGDDWVVGGKDNDLLSGEVGDDIVYGNLGNDWCDGGAGNDLVRGGQGNDTVLGQGGNDWLSGDRGDDTITGGAGADIFHGSQDAGIDRVTDFSLAQGDRVQLDPGTTYALRQSGADTVIDMGGGHQMVLVGVQLSTLTTGWIFGA